MTGAPHSPSVTIRPHQGVGLKSLPELIRYRSLLWSMIRGEVAKEFSPIWRGLLWSLARIALVTTLLVVFRRYSNAAIGTTLPADVYIFSGLTLFYYFTEATTGAAQALDRVAPLVTKVYFPKLIAPIVPVAARFANFAIATVVLIGLAVVQGVPLGFSLVLIPAALLPIWLSALGIGCIVASLKVWGADWDQALTLVLYVMLFASPVFFSYDIMPERVRILFELNPVAGPLEAFRSALAGFQTFPLWSYLYGLGFGAVSFVIGVLAFGAAERTLVDRL